MNSRTIKNFGIGSLTYIVVFLADYIYELFQINTNSTIVTMLGLKIKTVMTKAQIDSTFTLTWKILITYVIFMIIWMSIFYLMRNKAVK